MVTVHKQVRASVVLRGPRGAWSNGALLVGAHPLLDGGWAVYETAIAYAVGGSGQWETQT